MNEKNLLVQFAFNDKKLNIFKIFLMYMCVHMYYLCRFSTEFRREFNLPELEFIGSCELPNVGAENQTQGSARILCALNC